MKEGFKPQRTLDEQELVPLPRNEADTYLHNLVYGDIEFGSDTEADRILTQQEGLSVLNSFLLRKTDFSSLRIFNLDVSGEKYKRQSGQFQFYLGKLEEGTRNPFYLSISPAYYLGYEPEKIFVVPRMAEVGEKPYYWIEFTEEVTENAMRPPFISQRLRPDQPTTKIDSKYWSGLEEQLLVDFIQGHNGITISDLSPFRIKLNPKGHPYSLGAVQDLKLNLTGNSQILGGDELLVVPNTDPQEKYAWIDIFKEGGEGQEPTRVSTYRILQAEKRLSGLGWRNPETQYLVDYLSGNPRISFDNLRPVRFKLSERFNQISIGQGTDKYFSINVGNSTELGVEEVVLIPRQDQKGLYQWVEAYKVDTETGELVGEAVASARMIQGIGLESTGWLGADRQSLIDYSKGERAFDELLPISLQVGANSRMIDLWSGQNEHVYITFSNKSDLKSGDIVNLVPQREEDGVVIYKIDRGSTDLGLYSFDKETKKFSAIEIYDVRPKVFQPRDFLVEYSQGKIPFTDLKPLKLRVKKNTALIDIIKKGDIRIYIAPSRSFNLAINDEIELIPEDENNGRVIFAFVKDGEVLGKYIYDSKSMKFRQYELVKSYLSKETVEADNYLRDLVFGEDVNE